MLQTYPEHDLCRRIKEHFTASAGYDQDWLEDQVEKELNLWVSYRVSAKEKHQVKNQASKQIQKQANNSRSTTTFPWRMVTGVTWS